MPGESTSPLGVFLRAHREQITPEQVGLPDHGRRRVPGLRREELAMLAGVSVDYYVRLEQGRNDHPSPQVLDALARVLHLDDDTTSYLRDLAQPPPAPRRRPPARKAERVSPSLERVLHGLERQPALVLGRYMDVLATNPLMEALNSSHVVGANIVRGLFLNPESCACYPEWDKVASETVASLRASVGTDVDDPHLQQLVGELSLASEEFGKLWARHRVLNKTSGLKKMIHPIVGELELPYETLNVASAPGQRLLVYAPDPGTRTAEALTLLAGLIATGADAEHAAT